jgi:CMP-N,N'-diacetyllegionaminic acid synthase
MLAIIPARSGSKGLKNKNILNLNKKPLIYYTIKAALNAKLISRVVFITDSKKIADIAQKFGAEVPFLRPKKLATSNSMIIDTYKYTIDFFKENEGKVYKNFVALLPTSPLRTSEDIDRAISTFKKKNADSVISMKEAPFPIHWNKFLTKKEIIINYDNKFNPMANRQEHKKTYIPNGAIYVFNAKKIFNAKNYYFKKTYAYLMPKEKSVDIDDYFDFKFAELLLNKK